MSEFEELYSVFYKSILNSPRNKKYLEFDAESKSFWLVWGDESLYE